MTFVAKHLDISPFYVSKVFKKELGINFVTYVTEQKIEKAKEHLRNNDMSIVDLSFVMGFPDPSYFTKVFKKVENMTPSQYRNLYQRN